MDHSEWLLTKDAGDALNGKSGGQGPVNLDPFGLHVEDLEVIPFSHVAGVFIVANMPSAVSAVIFSLSPLYIYIFTFLLSIKNKEI